MAKKFNYNQIIEEQISHLQSIQGNLNNKVPNDILLSISIAKTISELVQLINEPIGYKSH